MPRELHQCTRSRTGAFAKRHVVPFPVKTTIESVDDRTAVNVQKNHPVSSAGQFILFL